MGARSPKESVFVIPPYDEFFGHAEKASTLLVNNTLRKEYVKLHTDIDKEKADFLESIKILRKVVLMTPENIHLNAFMYEPIVDMSDDLLQALYSEVCSLE